MIKGTITIRVRYSDTDRMGLMYYSRYLEYCEVARVELLRQAGIVYRHLEDSGIALPVVEARIKYLNPIFYDDLVTIITSIPEMPSVKVDFLYEFRVMDKICAEAFTRLAFIDMKTRKPVKPPPFFVEAVKRFFDG